MSRKHSKTRTARLAAPEAPADTATPAAAAPGPFAADPDEALRTLFMQLPVGLYRISADGRILQANPALAALLGCPEPACVFRHHASDFFVSERNYREWRARLEDQREIYVFEGPARRHDGSVIWVRNRVRVVRDEAGGIVCYEGALEDITERWQMRKALAAAEAKFRTLVERSLAGIYIVQDGRFPYVNPRLAQIFGYDSPEEIMAGCRVEDLVAPEDRALVAENLRQRIEGEVPSLCYTFRGLRKDGRIVHVEVLGTAGLYEGRPAVMGTLLDITEQRQAEKALRASETRLRAVLEAQPECVTILDHAGRLVQINAEGLRMLEADDPEGLRGQALIDLVTPKHREVCQAFLDAVRRGHKSSLTFEAVTRQGRRRWFESHAVAFTDPTSGEPLILAITRDITERKQAEESLYRLAHYDPLTGLPNRFLFTDRLRQAMIEADRHERLVGVAFLDLDRFKNVNDTLGHDTGDLLLKSVAERLSTVVRKGDTVSRLSGDEFTFVFADMAHVDDAALVAQKVLAAFSEPFRVADRELYVTASLGITIYPFDDQDVSGLLRNADLAMYRAKEAGGHRYQFYSAEMTRRVAKHHALEQALREAIVRGEFELRYQPIFACPDRGRVLAVEALICWRRPGRAELVAPGEFIPLAEETGLIVPIGEWVLRAACAQCRAWEAQGLDDLRVAVNLSARQFLHGDLVATVRAALEAQGLAPERLELEITESVLLQQEERTLETLRALDELGVRLAIDDFGTGYSSLSYLKRLPIDTLKIDRSFVRDLPEDSDDAAIVTAVVSLAQHLELAVVAEGVERVEQADFLCSLGCDGYQGHFIGPPQEPAGLTRLLTAAAAQAERRQGER